MDEYYQRSLDKFCAVSVSDPESIISSVNDFFCRVSGYERNELIGRSYSILKSATHGEDFYKDLWNTVSKGKVWKGEICNLSKDSTHYWVDTTIVPDLTATGEIIRYITYQVPINDPIQKKQTASDTNRQSSDESDDLYHSLVNNLPISVWRKNKEGKITYVNKTLVQSVKMEESELLGKTNHDLYPKELADKYEKDDKEVISSGVALHSVEPNIDLKTGEHIYIETIKIPIKGRDGSIEGLQGVFWNITESIETQKRLEIQNEQLTEIAWLHSHKIRGPVATIMGLMNIFDWTNMNDPQNLDIVRKVDTVSKQLDEIIHDVVKKTGDLYKKED
ncbi:MAG: PAS domain-containing protein [Imperialibacter sp.]